jgi:hypothetical protein
MSRGKEVSVVKKRNRQVLINRIYDPKGMNYSVVLGAPIHLCFPSF